MLDMTTMKVKTEEPWLVMFYAPWCGFSRQMLPYYNVVYDKVRNEGVKVAMVDCSVETDLCGQFMPPGYPTIWFLAGDKLYKNRAHRNPEQLYNYTVGLEYKETEESLVVDIPRPVLGVAKMLKDAGWWMQKNVYN